MSANLFVKNLYSRLEALPPNLVGEIINGQLHTHPRPAGPHAVAHSTLSMDIGSAYHLGRGGPGGWWIIIEPELHFVRDTEVLVPDIAGWRRERMLKVPTDHRFMIIPDWICEILSPSTAKLDRVEKMPVYARYGVRYLWLVDPLAKTLEVFQLNDHRWTLLATYQDETEVCIAPFQEIIIALKQLWVER